MMILCISAKQYNPKPLTMPLLNNNHIAVFYMLILNVGYASSFLLFKSWSLVGTVPHETKLQSINQYGQPYSYSRRTIFDSILIDSIITSLTLEPSIANAAIRDTKTGILLPSPGEIESSIPKHWDEDDNPYISSSSASFSRLDSSSDTIFYSEPRFVEHVDAQAVETMTAYISSKLLQPGDSVLDLCSSWTSHIASSPNLNLKRVAGLGMNAKELEANSALSEWVVMDLNADKNVKLPYEDSSFDVVMCQLSIDYLVHPLEVMKEASRVLKSGGKIAIIFSNRLFLTKAIGLWTGSDDIEHVYTVSSYLHFCKGGFVDIAAEDLSTRRQKGKEKVIVGDPLYVVTAIKG